MYDKTQTILLTAFGKPDESLSLKTSMLPPVRESQVLVKILYASINPADLSIVMGKYGSLPPLPITPGVDGVGRVAKIGPRVRGLAVGDKVIAPGRMGTWCEAYVADETQLIKVPPDIADEQAAFLSVNPPTAWLMLNTLAPLQTGDWIVQNAANSAVGRSVIDIARHRQFKVCSIVRRPELIPELEKAGSDLVLIDDEDNLTDAVRAKIGNGRIVLGLNAVGGRHAAALALCLDSGGTFVSYGAMASPTVEIDIRLLIYKDLRFRGIWRTEWFTGAEKNQINEMYSDLFEMAKQGCFRLPVEKIYKLKDFQQASSHAARQKRTGKILLTPG